MDAGELPTGSDALWWQCCIDGHAGWCYQPNGDSCDEAMAVHVCADGTCFHADWNEDSEALPDGGVRACP